MLLISARASQNESEFSFQLVDVVAELIQGQNKAVKRRDEDAERRRRLAEEALQERMRQLHEHLTREHKTHVTHLVQVNVRSARKSNIMTRTLNKFTHKGWGTPEIPH